MLTATYSLVAITAEQEKTRSRLTRFQRFVEASWKDLQAIDFGFLEAGFQRMLQFDQFLRQRKIELYLIPALKGLSREADLLIAELEALAAQAGRVLQETASELAARVEFSRIQVSQACESMQAYCRCVASRLHLEDQALLPLARRLLSVEDWFRLASEFLSRDSQDERKPAPPMRTPRHVGRSSDLY